MVSTLFSSLNTDLDDDDTIEDLQNVQPVLIVMQKTMPIFRQIAELWVEELDVLEVRILECIKLGNHMKKFKMCEAAIIE